MIDGMVDGWLSRRFTTIPARLTSEHAFAANSIASGEFG